MRCTQQLQMSTRQVTRLGKVHPRAKPQETCSLVVCMEVLYEKGHITIMKAAGATEDACSARHRLTEHTQLIELRVEW